MKIYKIYKYSGENGTVITPVNLGIPCTVMCRLVADEGKELIKDENRVTSIDVLPEEVELWRETEAEGEEI